MNKEQEEDLRVAYELLEKHMKDSFEDIRTCYVFWQCTELMRNYFEGKPII